MLQIVLDFADRQGRAGGRALDGRGTDIIVDSAQAHDQPRRLRADEWPGLSCRTTLHLVDGCPNGTAACPSGC